MLPTNANEWACAIGLVLIVGMLCAAVQGTLACDKAGPEDIYEYD